MLTFLYSISIYPLELIYKYLYIFCAHFLGGYGFGLICLSVVSTLIYRPMKKMTAGLQKKENDLRRIMAPQMARIKLESRGAERQERINRLYRRYSYHPLKSIRSSLGILIQVPFLIAAYNMIASFSPIQGLSFGPISDLGRPDGLLLGLNLLPILMTAFNIAAVYTTKGFSPKDQRQALALAFFFLLILYTAPAALLIYWTANNFFLLLENILPTHKPEFLIRACAPLQSGAALLRRLLSTNKSLMVAVLLPAFTFCFYAPVELFLHNSRELWFDLNITLITAVKGLLWCFALFMATGLLTKGRARLCYILFMSGLGLALYVQGSFLQPDYGVLDGRSVDWAAYGRWGVINSLIWAVLVALPFIIKHFKSLTADRIIRSGAVLLMAVQAATLLYQSHQGQAGLKAGGGNGEHPYYLSTKNMFTISPDQNIIVLLFDYMDVKFLDGALEAFPELRDSFKDFTFYHNTVGLYFNTLCSVPYILTGLEYRNQMFFSEYLLTAYRDSDMLTALQENEYAIDVYTDLMSMASSASYVSNFNNSAPLKVEDNVIFISLFYKFVGVKYLPHYLKKYVWIYSQDFEATKTIDLETASDLPYHVDDAKFYQTLLEYKITIDPNKPEKRFKFFHLMGSHPPWTLNEAAERVQVDETDAIKHTRGSLRIAEELLKQMRQSEVYEHSTIIILADHGVPHVSYFPALMIKRPHERKPFCVSEAPISYEDLMPTVMALLGFDPRSYGPTIYDWRPGQNRERRFLSNVLNFDELYLPPITEKMISGDSSHVTVRDTGIVYAGGQVYREGKVRLYSLGTVLGFRQAGDADTNLALFPKGMNPADQDFAWSLSREAELLLTLEEKPEKDLTVIVNLAGFAGRKQNILCRANGKLLDMVEINGPEDMDLRFRLPGDLINDDGRLLLKFEYPLAVAHESGEMALTMAFKSLVIQ